MFINTTPAAQVQQFKQILGWVHQELYKLLERRGLTGELPEHGPKGLRTKSSKPHDVKNLGTAGDCWDQDCHCSDDCFCDCNCDNDCYGCD